MITNNSEVPFSSYYEPPSSESESCSYTDKEFEWFKDRFSKQINKTKKLFTCSIAHAETIEQLNKITNQTDKVVNCIYKNYCKKIQQHFSEIAIQISNTANTEDLRIRDTCSLKQLSTSYYQALHNLTDDSIQDLYQAHNEKLFKLFQRETDRLAIDQLKNKNNVDCYKMFSATISLKIPLYLKHVKTGNRNECLGIEKRLWNYGMQSMRVMQSMRATQSMRVMQSMLNTNSYNQQNIELTKTTDPKNHSIPFQVLPTIF